MRSVTDKIQPREISRNNQDTYLQNKKKQQLVFGQILESGKDTETISVARRVCIIYNTGFNLVANATESALDTLGLFAEIGFSRFRQCSCLHIERAAFLISHHLR